MRKSDGTFLGTSVWTQVKQGPLGYVIGYMPAADGTLEACWTDVGGAYIRESTSNTWTQIANLNNIAPQATGQNFGSVAVAIAPTDSNKLLLCFRNHILYSSDRGVTWTDTNINGASGVWMSSQAAPAKTRMYRLVFDPSNAAVAYFGSQRDGYWQWMSGTWTKITSVPASTLADSGKLILSAVDNSSSLVGSGATSRRSIVWAGSSGNDVYKSTDGGTTFTATTAPGAGASFNLKSLFVGVDGVTYLVISNGASGNVYTWNGSAWVQHAFLGASYEVGAVFMDPKVTSAPYRFVGSLGSGNPWISDNGTSKRNWSATQQTASATNIPILAFVLNVGFAGGQSASEAAFIPHPTLSRDMIPMGYGVCYIDTWPASNATKINWIEDSVGISTLVGSTALLTPGGKTFVLSQDKAIIRIPTTGYATSSYPPYSLCCGFDADYGIDDENFIAVIANGELGGEQGGITRDGGLNWSRFPTRGSSGGGGCLAVGNANNIVYFPGQNGLPAYSTDGGTTWTGCTFAGYTQPPSGSTQGWVAGLIEMRRHIVAADKQNPGTFYAYNYGGADGASGANSRGIWKSTDNGANWTRVNTNPSPPSYIINPLFYYYHVQLRMDRGILYLTPGPSGSNFDGDNTNIGYRSEDGGVTWTAINELYEINLIVAGAPAPGSSLHTLYALAWKTILGTKTFGMYRSLDKGVSWTLIENSSNFDFAYGMAADPTKFGRVLVGYSGTGFFEMNYNYSLLLKGS